MAESKLTLNEFFVEGGNQKVSHVLLHITEPSTDEERKKGYFFAICEINNATTAFIELVQAAIDEVESGYYELPESADKTALELALEKINQRANTFVSDGIALNCIIGAIRQPEIIFSSCGSPTLLLFYKNRQNYYRSLNLLESPGVEGGADSTTLFSQIVQGKISPGDFIFAGSPHVQNFFTGDRLEKIITTRTPRQSAEHLERVLKELPNEFSFGGLIMHLSPANEQKLGIKKIRPSSGEAGSEQSLNNLFSTETNTSATLSPSIFNKMKSRLPNIKNRTEIRPNEKAASDFQNAEISSAHVYQHERLHVEQNDGRSFTDNAKSFVSLLLIGLRFVGRGLWSFIQFVAIILVKIFRLFALLFIVIINWQGKRNAVIEDWRRQWRFYKRAIEELPLFTKIIIVVTILVALIFAGSLIYLRQKQKQAALTAAYQEILNEITTKQNAAESDLIIHTSETDALALQEITSAKKLLAGLPCKEKAQATKCVELENALNSQLMRARKITTVKPELLTNWPSASVTSLVKISNKLIGLSATSSNLYLFDLLSHESKILPESAAFGGFIASAVPKENDYAIILDSKNKLESYNPIDDSLKNIEVSFPDDGAIIKSLVVYNRRLYTLDALHNQIYRHDAIKTGFGLGKTWLTDPNHNVKNGVDLATDGDVFVLNSDGSINKFTSGASMPFAIRGLDPALQNGGEIYSYNDLVYLYILDPVVKRLIILEKDGKFKSQLTAPELLSPTGLSIDEGSKTAYLLDKGKLYKIALPI